MCLSDLMIVCCSIPLHMHTEVAFGKHPAKWSGDPGGPIQDLPDKVGEPNDSRGSP